MKHRFFKTETLFLWSPKERSLREAYFFLRLLRIHNNTVYTTSIGRFIFVSVSAWARDGREN